MMTLRQILGRLRAGASPRDLGARKFNRGSERTAYLLDGWVIKERRPFVDDVLTLERLRANLRGTPVGVVRTYLAGDYVVQPRLRKLERDYQCRNRACDECLDKLEREGVATFDLGGHNTGYDKTGKLLAFDW